MLFLVMRLLLLADESTTEPIVPPEITILEPNSVDDVASTGYWIKWTDYCPYVSANINLFYGKYNTGHYLDVVVTGSKEDADGS